MRSADCWRPPTRRLRPGGRLVTNVATLESLSTTYQTLKEQAGSVEVLLISVARSVDQLEMVRLESVNPTFLLTVRKPEKSSAGNRMIEDGAPEPTMTRDTPLQRPSPIHFVLLA